MHTQQMRLFLVYCDNHVRFDPTQNYNFKTREEKKNNLQSELDKLTRHD